MKQKRKVKSLIPQKKFTSKSLKTAGLVFLGSALYLASITLLSTSVALGDDLGAQAQKFNGFDWTSPISDKAEVVYAARFATIEDLNNRIIDIFMNKDGVLYITPNPVIVNPDNEAWNYVESGVYGHVLGGKDNYVYSNNVTIIAGEKNKVKTGSDNATMLGGENNTINQGNGVPSAIIGGSENKIKENHNGSNVIIGGYNNTIEGGVSGSAILGGESNTIKSNTANAIIGGSNVTNDKNNVFAYSNDENFEPKNPNSFFLNMKKGVGINMEASGALNGLYVSGAVSLGDIDIKSKPCDSSHRDNYGLEGKYDGCLVGCTKDGWKMFDRGAKCEKFCKDNDDIFKECPRDADIPDSPDDYTGFCMGLADTSNATQCPELQTQMQNYKNVVFETKLIDSERGCPTNSEDKCIFKCDDDYHLLKDETGINSSTKGTKKCYKDCSLPRNPDEKRKTNEKIIAYNTTISYCATNADEVYDNCGNHKEELVCYDGSRYYTKNKQKNNGHEFKTCETKEYTCPANYDLTRRKILEELQEDETSKTWNLKDRSTTTLTRGKYKLCLDYDPQDDHDAACVEKDKDRNPHTEHYQFVECNEPDYYEFKDKNGTTRCMKSCTFNTNSGQIRVKHNESTGLYLSDNTTCPDPCKKQTFRCDDGTWKNTDGADINDYKFTSCNLNSQVHDGYNISENDFIRNKNNFTTYDHINISVKDRDIFSCKEEIRYKITGCADGYHLSSTLKFCTREATRGECGGLPDNYERTSQDQEPFHDGLLGDIDRSKGSTRGKNFRIGTWDNRQYEPDRDKCTKDCIEGYEKRNGQCVKDGECDLYNINQCSDGGNSSHEYTSDGNHLWRCEGDGGKTAYCHICADGYSWEGTDNEYDPVNKVDYCAQPEPDEDGECKNYDTSNESRAGKIFDLIANELKCKHGTSEIAQGFIHNGYSWLCKGSGNGSDSDLCHKCEPGYTWDPNEGDYGDCVEGNGDNGECIDCVTPVNGKCNTGTTNFNSWPQNDKDLCTEGEPKNKYGPNDNKYTWNCIGTGGGTSENGCFRCKNGTILSGNKCVNPTTNAKCGTKSNGKYFTSLAHLMETNNLCDNGNNTDPDLNEYTSEWSWTCSDSVGFVTCSATKLGCGDAEGKQYSNKNQIEDNLKCKPSTLNSTDISVENNQFIWRCKGDGDSDKKCTATKVNFSCSKTYENAYLITGSDSITEATTSQLFDNETAANGKKCAYVCIAGYHKDGEVCKINTCSTNTPGENTIRGSGTPSTHNKTWDYIDSTTLGACEWTCVSGYQRSGNKCVEKQCGTTGLPSSMNGVLTGKSTYVGTDNNRNWQYNSGTLGACQWKCKPDYEKSGNGCIRTVHASCGNPAEHFECDGEGTPTNQQTGRDGSTPSGWTWKCQGTPGGSSQDCVECNTALGYEDTLHNGTCVKENNKCGGEEPQGEGVIKNPNYGNGPTSWTYVDDPNFNVMSAGCTWKCDSQYIVNDDETGCVLDTGPQCGLATLYSNPRNNKTDLCENGSSYSNAKIKFDPNPGYGNRECLPYYEWECSKGTQTTVCTNDKISKLGVRVYRDILNSQAYWLVSNTFYSFDSYYNNISTDGLEVEVLYYSSVDGYTNAPRDERRMTLVSGSPMHENDIGTLYRLIQTKYIPNVYEYNNQEFILFPMWNQYDHGYTTPRYFVCPKEFSL